MNQLICISTLLSLIVGLQASGCPMGFTQVGKKCYKGFLEAYLKNNGIPFNKGYLGGVWMGINSLGQNPHFVASHDGAELAFKKWMPYKPDNWAGIEECVVYSEPDVIGFNDVFCTNKFSYVCQTKFDTKYFL